MDLFTGALAWIFSPDRLTGTDALPILFAQQGRLARREQGLLEAAVAARNAAVDARLARARAEIALARLQGRLPFGTSL